MRAFSASNEISASSSSSVCMIPSSICRDFKSFHPICHSKMAPLRRKLKENQQEAESMHIVPNWRSPVDHLRRQQPDRATLYFCPGVLAATARRFLDGFPGVVSYAVKANPGAEVLGNLAAAGIGVFDVASPMEMRAVRAACPGAVLHYNNPVRSTAGVAMPARTARISIGLATSNTPMPAAAR